MPMAMAIDARTIRERFTVLPCISPSGNESRQIRGRAALFKQLTLVSLDSKGVKNLSSGQPLPMRKSDAATTEHGRWPTWAKPLCVNYTDAGSVPGALEPLRWLSRPGAKTGGPPIFQLLRGQQLDFSQRLHGPKTLFCWRL